MQEWQHMEIVLLYSQIAMERTAQISLAMHLR